MKRRRAAPHRKRNIDRSFSRMGGSANWKANFLPPRDIVRPLMRTQEKRIEQCNRLTEIFSDDMNSTSDGD